MTVQGRDESVADENGGSVRQRLRPANSGHSSRTLNFLHTGHWN